MVVSGVTITRVLPIIILMWEEEVLIYRVQLDVGPYSPFSCL